MADDFDDMIDGKDLEPSQKTQKGVFYAMIVFFSLVYVMFGVPTEEYSTKVTHEVNSLKTITGKAEFKEVTERASRWYDFVMIQSGGQAALRRLFAETDKEEKLKFGAQKWTNRLANNIPYIIYQATFRCSSVVLWGWLLLPVLAASVIDAMNLWRAKIYGFGQMKVRKFHLWRRLWSYVLVGVFAFFLVPALVGAYTVYIPPAILLITAYLITRWIKEYQVQL